MRHPVVDLKSGKVYIDPVGGFYVEPCSRNSEKVQKEVEQYRPDFEKEDDVVGIRHLVVNPERDLVILDPASKFYRVNSREPKY